MGNKFNDGAAGIGNISGNTKFWRFFGIPRSGNHAVIEWFIANLNPAKTVFLNNCKEGNPFTGFSYCNYMHDGHWRKHRANIYRERNIHFERLLDHASRAPQLVLSYEIMSPKTDARKALLKGSGIAVRPERDILIIRSPLNLIASNLKRAENEILNPQRHERAVRNMVETLPKTYMEYLEATNTSDPFAIIYDRWSADEAYRAQILDTLGIKQRQLELGGMTSAGGGSSFDREQSVSTISTTNRWRKMGDDPMFLQIAKAMLNADASDRIKEFFPRDFEILRDL